MGGEGKQSEKRSEILLLQITSTMLNLKSHDQTHDQKPLEKKQKSEIM
jgi:hypothetical protein